jgi:hypothetical protein
MPDGEEVLMVNFLRKKGSHYTFPDKEDAASCDVVHCTKVDVEMDSHMRYKIIGT